MAEKVRRWRGEIDVPLTAAGLGTAYALGAKLSEAGGLSLCFHDWLSRCRNTAEAVCSETIESHGPRPWRMGPAFEGHPITRLSINYAQFLAEHPEATPQGGEPFGRWYAEWMEWLSGDSLPVEYGAKLGIVTHNRNLQAISSTVNGHFDAGLYNCDGPGFCTVHFYKDGKLMPWNEKTLMPGVYLIRHGETSFGP